MGLSARDTLSARSKKSGRAKSFLQYSDLTRTTCWARVWNQFQSLWSFLEASGVCDEETVCSLFPLHDYVCSAGCTQSAQTVAPRHGRTARNDPPRVFSASPGSSGRRDPSRDRDRFQRRRSERCKRYDNGDKDRGSPQLHNKRQRKLSIWQPSSGSIRSCRRPSRLQESHAVWNRCPGEQ